jgi:hypothetical protein
MFVTKNTSVYNIEYMHIENLAHGGLDLVDSSMLTVNPARWSSSALEKTTKNPFHQ